MNLRRGVRRREKRGGTFAGQTFAYPVLVTTDRVARATRYDRRLAKTARASSIFTRTAAQTASIINNKSRRARTLAVRDRPAIKPLLFLLQGRRKPI